MRDEELIELFCRRDETAIAATADVYGKYCYRVAFQILQSNEDAEECVNETWWKAWSAIPPHRPERLSTFLGKITRNLALDRWKRSHAQRRSGDQVVLALEELAHCVPSAARVEDMMEEREIAKSIEQFLLTYSERERKIFVGRYWYLYSISELAAAYHMSESRVASLLYRMRKKLKKYLEKEEIFL